MVWWCRAMCGIDEAPGLAFQHRMAGDELAVCVDPKLSGVMLHLERAAPFAVGNGVEIAPNRDH